MSILVDFRMALLLKENKNNTIGVGNCGTNNNKYIHGQRTMFKSRTSSLVKSKSKVELHNAR